ncbi:unnamed protein product [Blepharisma stoltei]|uniref:Hydroxymethylglutaryl-CoA synthase n=1 Tax=Blepharisma stoltei TaxID=1481888 RepID=A0AAU9JE41_9CILI|nr:unnamed protein product [Blepharisma stoltei]
MSGMARPADIGILAAEIYFPKTYVEQSELESFDNVGKGKYTLGLGQLRMSCIGDREDINSISSTVVVNLLEKNHVSPRDIGRLEIGTETIQDKAKSTKTFLMNLFKGNEGIEGITTINACYGGIQAFFNTVAWIESRAWDGRLGIVVAADIAVYERGPARATGGAGAVAFLIGPNAPLVLAPIRSTYMVHAYDFYKPIPQSEYPVVDGHHSIDCYIDAIHNCYESLKQKTGTTKIEELAEYLCFHAPFYKMTRRAFNKMFLTDMLNHPKVYKADFSFTQNPNIKDPKVYEIVNRLSQEAWNRKCEPATFLGKQLGNLYCGSLPASLISLICDPTIDLKGKRVLLFAYGSGLASSMFTLYMRPDAQNFINQLRANNPIRDLLQNRIKLTPDEYTRRMDKRESDYVKTNYTPRDPLDEIPEGAFYLVKTDNKWRRFYARKIARPKL